MVEKFEENFRIRNDKEKLENKSKNLVKSNEKVKLLNCEMNVNLNLLKFLINFYCSHILWKIRRKIFIRHRLIFP